MPRIFQVILRTFAAAVLLAAGPAVGGELQEFKNCHLVATAWADGDSFEIACIDGKRHTIRLYGADCFEWHVTDETDARRLRAQRRYFGMTGFGGSPEKSIQAAKNLGEAAAKEITKVLAKPFTVHTAFADAMGDGRHRRIYAFETTANRIIEARPFKSLADLRRVEGIGPKTLDRIKPNLTLP